MATLWPAAKIMSPALRLRRFPREPAKPEYQRGITTLCGGQSVILKIKALAVRTEAFGGSKDRWRSSR
jgi:hypothetical protein